MSQSNAGLVDCRACKHFKRSSNNIWSGALLERRNWHQRRIDDINQHHLNWLTLAVPRMMGWAIYSALAISRGHFYSNNLRKTAIARPLGRGMAIFREFEIWSKFFLRSCCTACNIVLYCAAIYREYSIYILDWKRTRGTNRSYILISVHSTNQKHGFQIIYEFPIRQINRSQVDSHHKVSVMRKKFWSHDIFMI